MSWIYETLTKEPNKHRSNCCAATYPIPNNWAVQNSSTCRADSFLTIGFTRCKQIVLVFINASQNRRFLHSKPQTALKQQSAAKKHEKINGYHNTLLNVKVHNLIIFLMCQALTSHYLLRFPQPVSILTPLKSFLPKHESASSFDVLSIALGVAENTPPLLQI